MTIQTIDKIGDTAFIIAVYRAEEKDCVESLFIDDYAKYFVNPDVIQKANDFAKVLPEGKEMIRYRIGYFNHVIQDNIDNGVTQIVMLGGGFDMRACYYRRESVQFFDVDQKEVIDFKRSVIAKNNIDYPSKCVACNYITDDVIEGLCQQGFQCDKPSLFVWEGNIHYIPKPEVYTFLSYLKKNISQMQITFDYLFETVVNHQCGIASVDKAVDFFASMGSPWITGFDQLDILGEKTGMKVISDMSMDTVAQKYMQRKSDETGIFSVYLTAILGT